MKPLERWKPLNTETLNWLCALALLQRLFLPLGGVSTVAVWESSVALLSIREGALAINSSFHFFLCVSFVFALSCVKLKTNMFLPFLTRRC